MSNNFFNKYVENGNFNWLLYAMLSMEPNHILSIYKNMHWIYLKSSKTLAKLMTLKPSPHISNSNWNVVYIVFKLCYI